MTEDTIHAIVDQLLEGAVRATVRNLHVSRAQAVAILTRKMLARLATTEDANAKFRFNEFQGSEPEHVRDELRAFGRAIKAAMPPGWGFTLLMFTYGEGGNLMYLSSGTRETMVKTMRECIAKLEAEPS